MENSPWVHEEMKANTGLNNWKPIEAVDGKLHMESQFSTENPVITDIDCSEGDTLFIRQDSWYPTTQIVALGKDELLNVVHNFMTTEELEKVLTFVKEQEKAK